MAEAIALMDIDEEENQNHLSKPNKGKKVVVPATPPGGKATPWVEKYRPQSLADVAAHRDIIDTSYYLLSLSRVSVIYTRAIFLS
jgi:replication factor C subunit 3/5